MISFLKEDGPNLKILIDSQIFTLVSYAVYYKDDEPFETINFSIQRNNNVYYIPIEHIKDQFKTLRSRDWLIWYEEEMKLYKELYIQALDKFQSYLVLM